MAALACGAPRGAPIYGLDCRSGFDVGTAQPRRGRTYQFGAEPSSLYTSVALLHGVPTRRGLSCRDIWEIARGCSNAEHGRRL